MGEIRQGGPSAQAPLFRRCRRLVLLSALTLALAVVGGFSTSWALWFIALPAAVIGVFNAAMNLRAAREAERIACDDAYGGAFESLEYVGRSDLGVLLLHGLRGTPLDFAPLMEQLRERGISYYAPMLGGTRPSPTAGLTFTPDFLAHHAEEAYAHLARRCPRVVVVGYSLGGVQALDLATRRSVEGIVMVAPAFGLARRPLVRPSMEWWIRTLAPLLPMIPQNRHKLNNEARQTELIGLRTVALKSAVALLDYAPQVLRRVDQVRSPVLCMLSRGDELADSGLAERAVRSLPTSGRRIAWYDRSNHAILMDYDSSRATKHIVEFITDRVHHRLWPRANAEGRRDRVVASAPTDVKEGVLTAGPRV